MLSVDFLARIGNFELQVTFHAEREIVAVVGPSGAGKSLTLQCLAGLFRPLSGAISLNDRLFFDSERRVHVPARQRRIGYVVQSYALFPHLGVAQNLAFGLAGLPRDAVRRRVADLVDMLGLVGFEERRPHQLSGGQQQRVAIGRALAIEPELLLLDEPFSALDPVTKAGLTEDLLAIHQQLGLTTVLVTHDVYDAYSLSKRMMVLDQGRVLQSGAKEEVFHRPVDATVARLTGIRNLFSGRVAAAAAEGLTLAAGGVELLAPAGPFGLGEELLCCVRPEDVTLVRPDRTRRAASGETRLAGRIVRELDHGIVHTLFFRLDDLRLTPERDYDLEIRLGGHTYRVLEVDRRKQWTVALKRPALHLMRI